MTITRRFTLAAGLAAAAVPFAAQAADDGIISVTAPGAELGEGPVWSPARNGVFWVDILAPKLHFHGFDGKSKSWPMPQPVGWAVERKKGGLIVGLKDGAYFLDPDTGALTPAVSPEPGKPDNRLNDAKVDAKGRLWTGTMHMPFKEKVCALYRIDPDLSVRKMDEPYLCTNGPAFSRDGTRMYHNETADGIVYAFDVDADGNLSNKRVFARFAPGEGLPDGCTVDADDGLWTAHYGGGRITRWRPDGTQDFHIKMPARNITSLTFAGPNLDRVFVTSAAQEHRSDDPLAGTLFEVPKALLRGHKGLPTQQFAG